MTALAFDLAIAPTPPTAVEYTCAHCSAALPAGSDKRFCCMGCEGAYRVIHELGLDRFYRLRTQDGKASLRPPEEARADYSSYVIPDRVGHSTLHLMLDGLTCAACVWLIESVLAREPAILDGRVNLTTRRLTLRWNGPPADAARLTHLVTALGFRVVPFDPRRLAASVSVAERDLLRAMAVAGFAAGNIMLLSVAVWAGHVEGMGLATRDLLHWFSSLIALPAIAYAGRPFFRSAFAAIKARRTNMDVPISIGVILAAAVSLFETATSGTHAYFDSATTLLFFLLIGRYLDVRARGRARSAVEHLLSLSASAITVVRPDGTTASKPPSAIEQGDIVLAAAGERIPVDGRVVLGRSDIDTSLVTGETAPLATEPGMSVFAGMLNLSAPLRISVTATGERTLLADIVRLMEAAEQGRARYMALADRVARLYAPVVHIVAAATFLGWIFLGAAGWQPALLTAVAVLIITCPCALALAVPVVQVVASARLLRIGILLKSASALERLAQVDTIVVDKTGTLTLGRPELQSDDSRTEADLRLAASMAQASRHPLARALVRACPKVVALADVVEQPGRGLVAITAEGDVRLGSAWFCGAGQMAKGQTDDPELWLARSGCAPVRFAFADRLRPDAAAVVAQLKAAGLEVELLSGDRKPVVAAVAEVAGIAAWRGGYDPAAKCRRLAELRTSGRRPLMVGDGLNDAPALAAAYVSISPASAVDVSQTAADVVFQGDKLAPIAEILRVAKASERLVRQNLALAIFYNAAAVPLAIAGYVTPLVAAIAMSSSSLLVIGNALRLSRSTGWR